MFVKSKSVRATAVVATNQVQAAAGGDLPALHICQQARLSRDARFDGLFFIAVKSTGIYCRTICPVRPPAEQQVSYYPSAFAAAQAGYRPCLRCRPDSACRGGRCRPGALAGG